ncbi:hypothetical protein [Variovorax sp. OV329]|uniref:hypothetical protein n=1 Tax=Variovorax sp. OV329 TaxID=1882825 RepID=UPI0008E9645B|nr:hypothetical protein [Variovorax sp. OV329]SFM75123.1 hypothetical protein SAMN05444747_108140 [Variovorax sp. OV329]
MQHEVDVWSVEGQFQHLIYSPKGAIEGFLISTDGVPMQFVTDPHAPDLVEQLGALREGQAVVVEGIEAGPSPKGEAVHSLYAFERLASVDGKEPKASRDAHEVAGTVVRFNYARHGAPNGVVLDSGDFVHTRPGGFEKLGLEVGDKLVAQGDARPLVTGTGRVIEARRVNGQPID